MSYWPYAQAENKQFGEAVLPSADADVKLYVVKTFRGQKENLVP